jgi:hypothetical protein
MQKVYIFGDCHTARLQEHIDLKDLNINLKMWGKAGTKIWNLNLETLIKENTKSSGVETYAKTGIAREETIVRFSEIKDDGIVMPWLGYVDIRQFLARHKNADEVAKKYVEEVIKNYPNSKIWFIEPLPQFTEMLLKYEGISPSYTYEERQEQNSIFIEALNLYCSKNNLLKPISQQEMYSALGVDKFTTDMTPQDRPHPTDCLVRNDMEKLYNLIINKVQNSLT